MSNPFKEILKEAKEETLEEIQRVLVFLFAGEGKKSFSKDWPAIYEEFKEYLFKRMERTFR